ncbi:phage membrane protein [Proteus hauseri ZMd44]|nr:phage membrane protein [Proteus hauseri ZMd44]
MIDLFKLTKKSSRHISIAIYVGIIAGIFSALVKSGFEDLIPPRTLETTPPPVVLLEKLGLNIDTMTYHWMGYSINWGGNGVHILFSIVIAVIYCVIAEYLPKVKLLHGICFGIGVSVFAHGLVVPLLGLSSWLWTAGYQALVSEFVGTAFWIWSIEAIRQNLRYCLTKEKDAE